MIVAFSWFLIFSFSIFILIKNDSLTKLSSFLLLIYYYSLPFFNLKKTNSVLIKSNFDKKLPKNTVIFYLFFSYIFSMLVYSLTQSLILNKTNKKYDIFQFDIGSSALIIGEFVEEFSRFTFLIIQKESKMIGYVTISALFTIIHYSNLNYFKVNYLEYYVFIFIFSFISIQIGNKLGWKYSVILHIIVNFFKFYFII